MGADPDIVILGLGLMGGSLGLALKTRGYRGRVSGYARRAETRELALARGAVDAVYDEAEAAVRGSPLVVVCAPVLAIPDLISRVAPALQPDAVVTDVGSTKDWIVRRAQAVLSGRPAEFVGSHPVAGSEQQGMEAARADLYEGAVTVVTPDGAGLRAVAAVEALWKTAGSRIVSMSAADHDRGIARTSHLPHLAAALTALCAGRPGMDDAAIAALCGPGIRDTTRIAGGSPDLWHDIVMTNPEALLVELDSMRDAVEALIDRMRARDFESIREILARARDARRRIVTEKSRCTEEPA